MKKKILIGVPHYSGIPGKFVVNITNMSLHLVDKGYAVNTFYSQGTIISSQRNKIAQAVVDEEYDHLFFVDCDMVFAPQEINKLLEMDVDIVGGLYYARRPKHRPLAFKDFDGLHYIGMKQHEIDAHKGQPFKCFGVGTGFLLIKGKVLKKMYEKDYVEQNGYPFNFWQTENGTQMGEDLSFCYRAKELGHDIWCHPGVDLGHESTMIVNKETHLHYLQHDMHYCNRIPGWMFVKELNWLYEKSKEMDTICEVGSWKGRSTHALCSGVRGSVWAVDHFEGSVGEEVQHSEADEGTVEDLFMHYVGNRFKNVHIQKMSSLEFAEICKEKGMKFDMVFLDGGHQHEEVKDDIDAWLPLTRKIICGHDYNVFPGVTRAVDERFEGRIGVCETIWYKEIG